MAPSATYRICARSALRTVMGSANALKGSRGLYGSRSCGASKRASTSSVRYVARSSCACRDAGRSASASPSNGTLLRTASNSSKYGSRRSRIAGARAASSSAMVTSGALTSSFTTWVTSCVASMAAKSEALMGVTITGFNSLRLQSLGHRQHNTPVVRGSFTGAGIKIACCVPPQGQLTNYMKENTGQRHTRSISRERHCGCRFPTTGWGPRRTDSVTIHGMMMLQAKHAPHLAAGHQAEAIGVAWEATGGMAWEARMPRASWSEMSLTLRAKSLGPVPDVFLGSPSRRIRHFRGRAPRMAESLSAASCCASS